MLNVRALKHFYLIFVCSLLLGTLPANAETKGKPPGYQRDVSTTERWQNFGMVYGAQWGFYLLSQENEIRTHGSFENWKSYPFQPHFDKDHLDFNLTKHTLAGSAYYLYYRARGYTYQSAFLWSVISSLAFEFTIETVTEKPSFQDMYQTPVFGSVIGFGLDYASRSFYELGTWYGHGLGFLFNPFSIFSSKQVLTTLNYNEKSFLMTAKWEF